MFGACRQARAAKDRATRRVSCSGLPRAGSAARRESRNCRNRARQRRKRRPTRGSMMRLRFGALLIAAAVAGVLVSAVAEAQTSVAADERLLTVSGEGSVEGTPDIALITLGVVSEAPAARGALSANSQSMNRILGALKDGGIEPRDLQTSGFSVEPVYSQPPADHDTSAQFEPEIVGYRVRNNVTLRIRDLKRVGPLLDEVVTLGANSITGPSFTV